MSNPNATPPPPMTAGRKQIRGREQLALIADLAAGDLTFQELADKYGRDKTTVFNFAHRAETEAAVRRVREAKGDRLAALWVADKANRVSELQDSIERLTTDHEGPPDPARERATAAALRAVAEELGQLTTKVEGAFTVFQVEGVDMDKL